MSECKSINDRARSMPEAINEQEAHQLSKNEAPKGYQSDSACNGKSKAVDIKTIGAINPHADKASEWASESAIESSFQFSQSTKNMDSRLSGSPLCSTPSSRIQSVLPSDSRGSGAPSTVTLASGADSGSLLCNGQSGLSSGMYLPIPPMYEDLPESSPWPTLYELEINESIRDSLTALTMVEFKEATVSKQLRKPWACFSKATLGYDPSSFKPLSYFTRKSSQESQPWFQSLYYTFTSTGNSGVKRPRSPTSNVKHLEMKRKRVAECDCKKEVVSGLRHQSHPKLISDSQLRALDTCFDI